MARPDTDPCLETAIRKNLETFTLIEQDKTAPETICEWIKMNVRTCPPEKLIEALKCAIRMSEHPDARMPD